MTVLFRTRCGCTRYMALTVDLITPRFKLPLKFPISFDDHKFNPLLTIQSREFILTSFNRSTDMAEYEEVA